MARTYVNPIVIDKAPGRIIMWKNFSGKATKYNREGDRNFNIELDPETVDIQRLIDEGWNIKKKEYDEDDRPDMYYMPVFVNYNYSVPPEVDLIVESYDPAKPPHGTHLDEESIGELDHTVITTAQVVLRPRVWFDDDGNQRVKAYLEKLVAWTKPVYFAADLDGVEFD